MKNEKNKKLRILKEMIAQGNDEDEFIVALHFDHSGVTYEGRRIMTREEIGKLCAGLEANREVIIQNNQGNSEVLHVRMLKQAFSIDSDLTEEIEKMRVQHGESVGETRLFDDVVHREPPHYFVEIIDTEAARNFLDDPLTIHFEEATCMHDDAAALLAKYDGELCFRELTNISDAALASLSQHQGRLILSSLDELSDAAAESLSNHKGSLSLGALSYLSDAAAESLSKHQGSLRFFSLSEISDHALIALSKLKGDLDLGWEIFELSDIAAEALSKHVGDLAIDEVKELTDNAARHLSKKTGTICRMNPAEWVASLKS